jgi:hypothetical protein
VTNIPKTCENCKYAYYSSRGYWCNVGTNSTENNPPNYTCDAFSISHYKKEKE